MNFDKLKQLLGLGGGGGVAQAAQQAQRQPIQQPQGMGQSPPVKRYEDGSAEVGGIGVHPRGHSNVPGSSMQGGDLQGGFAGPLQPNSMGYGGRLQGTGADPYSRGLPGPIDPTPQVSMFGPLMQRGGAMSQNGMMYEDGPYQAHDSMMGGAGPIQQPQDDMFQKLRVLLGR